MINVGEMPEGSEVTVPVEEATQLYIFTFKVVISLKYT
jgi:hypothetical protein